MENLMSEFQRPQRMWPDLHLPELHGGPRGLAQVCPSLQASRPPGGQLPSPFPSPQCSPDPTGPGSPCLALCARRCHPASPRGQEEDSQPARPAALWGHWCLQWGPPEARRPCSEWRLQSLDWAAVAGQTQEADAEE
uniref:Uncharacterized protein n=1 Tax=Pipistrellus kuhlii TaxID=59472 RepID=A0A7J7VBL8_PIPKU|nr:hypothetical protein mPipKuh1_008527 [Pipistrellus kuhlii]